MNGSRQFADRNDAGRQLAAAVAKMDLVDPVVLALPRGGVPLGFEIAKALHAPLDILMVRKIGAPGHEEYGIGAVIDGAAAQVVIDEDLARMVGATRDYIQRQITRELKEIERRRAIYRPGPSEKVGGRTVVVVDDGIATGSTVLAALKGLAGARPSRIVLAVPVAPRDVLSKLREYCDDMICLYSPDPFYAVGAHYRNFDQTGDEEVIRCLAKANRDLSTG